MNGFSRKNGELHCEGVPLSTLATEHGTPLYVYSKGAMRARYREFTRAFDGTDHIICFAAKANSGRAVLETLAAEGAGADIVSGGELFRALGAGIPASKIVYSGVGKTVAEMRDALNADILMFNIESFSELQVLNDIAGEMGKRPMVSLRVNPGVDPRTHPYVATGLKTSKFGIRFESVMEGYERAAKLINIDVAGVDCHIGSQLSSIEPFVEALERVKELLASLREKGLDIRYLDIGGGLGITYQNETPPSPTEYGGAVKKLLADEPATLVLEPGRSILGNAGVLLTRVLYTKKADDRRFAIVDAGMNDLVRPSLYGAYHRVEHVDDANLSRPVEQSEVVGPICESGDFLARDRTLPGLRAGDLMAVMSSGAYGASMSSTYNSRPLAAEVMVLERGHALVRRRGTHADLIAGEMSCDLT